MMAALLSRCLYRSYSTSRSFFMFFLLGCSNMAWKLTGSPYLWRQEGLLNSLFAARVLRRKSQRWTGASLPQHWLHKHSQSFYVNPGDEGFAEIHFQPSDQRTLQPRNSNILLSINNITLFGRHSRHVGWICGCVWIEIRLLLELWQQEFVLITLKWHYCTTILNTLEL